MLKIFAAAAALTTVYGMTEEEFGVIMEEQYNLPPTDRKCPSESRKVAERKHWSLTNQGQTFVTARIQMPTNEHNKNHKGMQEFLKDQYEQYFDKDLVTIYNGEPMPMAYIYLHQPQTCVYRDPDVREFF